MPKKPQPIESFARALEAIDLAHKKCDKTGDNSCMKEALESAKNNLLQGLESYKEQQIADAEVFANMGTYGIMRGVDCEKAEAVLKKLHSQ